MAAFREDEVEMDKVDFMERRDKDEDRRNDGKRYSGLLSYQEYNKRKAHCEETMDMQEYMRKKAAEFVDKDTREREAAEEARKERLAKKKEALQAELSSKEEKKNKNNGLKQIGLNRLQIAPPVNLSSLVRFA
ncbi:hypothetical protein CYMTET_50299 [Cymbomonas tetramitiformis]|uniref:Uncharacterized protein n=1 Tax=Cymbomonas tetramitiformis TaxID=36881 RepID=A0AAE0BNC3_9CHLO|nr:hypothetical protein CYMTET_50299 [Cymbomonas tetramitiformis]